ncbi:hypothetical protein TIFTF001_033557 [Ficus carica]|uniref:Uncharacterized protein n=1 Tax=Ficus carica TaxID=3494 RepID=A0AA88E5J1_FICCA|nr:hypothetical protein TIFTF001_033557 [Ficus carica]
MSFNEQDGTCSCTLRRSSITQDIARKEVVLAERKLTVLRLCCRRVVTAWGRGRTGQAGGRAGGRRGRAAGERRRERKGKIERREERERGRERKGGRRRPASRGWGRWWGGRRWVAVGERKRERKRKREKGGSPAAGRGWGRWWVAGVRGGSSASVVGSGKVAGDGEDFGWEG